MPRNNGIYTPPPSNWWPAVDGQPADPSSWNDLLADIAAALSQSIARDGQTQITGDINFGGNRAINIGTPTAPGDAARYGMLTRGENIASAATITIPTDGILFDVTGTTDISAITGGFPGKLAFLRFSSEINIKHSATLIMPGGNDYRTSPGELVLMVRIGTAWQLFSTGGSYQIGDFLDTLRSLDNKWLRRNGALYDVSDYPELAALMPPLPDGVLWSQTPTVQSLSLGAIVAGSERVVAAQSQGGRIISSTDLETWSVVADLPDIGISAVAFGAGVYVATDVISGRVIVSQDGETWSQSGVIDDLGLFGVAFGNGFFVVVAGSGGGIYTSSDGVSWSHVQTSITAGGTARFINGRFFVMGSAGNMYHTNNVSTWTLVSIPGAGVLNDIAYYDGIYVVVANGGGIFTSTNLTSWTPRSSGTTQNIRSVIGNENGFIAVGDSGLARISDTNAVTWGGVPTGVTSVLRQVIIDPNRGDRYLITGIPGQILKGIRTLPTQFQVPDDNPQYGWIKAL